MRHDFLRALSALAVNGFDFEFPEKLDSKLRILIGKVI
jgi:hypothetical protein